MDKSQWNFRPNTQDEFVYNEVYVNNCYRLPDDLSGKFIIDIGANIGAFTIACLERNADYVFAYEPDPGNFAQLYANIRSSGLSDRVTVYNQFVVGDGRQERFIEVREGYQMLDGTLLTGGVSLFVPPAGNRAIEAIQAPELFDFIASDSIWLKLDCEGAEYEILHSAIPRAKVERIFGEIHTYLDGKLSRDTERVNIPDEEGIWMEKDILVSHLESVGYQVETEDNLEDPHLSLFWASREQEKRDDRPEGLPPIYDTHGSLNSIADAVQYADKLEGLSVVKEETPHGYIDSFGEAVRHAAESEGNRDDCIDVLDVSTYADTPGSKWLKREGAGRKSVCVLTPFRNARKYLPLYFSQMSSLRDALLSEGYILRLVAAEGDSLDNTRERIQQLAIEYNLPLTLVDTTHGHMRWGSVEDPIRMKAMSDVMNRALDQVQETDDVVVWIMSDLKWNAEDIKEMIFDARRKGNSHYVFAPLVLSENDTFYDTWAFRMGGKRFHFQFPYHSRMSSVTSRMWILDSAGTCLVMLSSIARDCRADKEEAVSFCFNAKTEGHEIVLDCQRKVYHAPAPRKRLLWISDAVCTSGLSKVSHAMFPILSEAGYELDIVATNYHGTPHNYPYRIWPASVDGNGNDPSGMTRAKMLVYSAHVLGSPFDLIVYLTDPWNVKALLAEMGDLQTLHNVVIPPIVPWLTIDGKNINTKELDSCFIPRIMTCTDFGALELAESWVSWANNDNWNPAVENAPVSLAPFGANSQIYRLLDKQESRSLVCGDEIPSDSFIVGIVSTNQLRKRLDLTLQYFSEWVHNHNVENALLYLCLSASNSTGCDIYSLVKYYGLQKRVILNTQLLSEPILAHVYSSFDVYLSIPQGEGFGLTTLEAMACGVPCIVSDWAAYSSWIPDDCAIKVECTSTALSSPLNSQAYVIGGVADKEQTVGALSKLYLYENERRRLSENGLRLAKSLSWENAGRELVKVLDNVVDSISFSSSSDALR